MRSSRFALVLLLLGTFACQDSAIVEPEFAASAEKGRIDTNAFPVTVALPFNADVSVWDHSDYTDTRCGGFPVMFLTMKGHGTATHLGSLTTTMTFCVNVLTGTYYNTTGSFIAANGDELFVTIPNGSIVVNTGDDAAYYQTRFDDPGYFVGGTGRFEGATGTWTTNAFVHDGADEWRTDFFPTGTLYLVTAGQ